MTSEELLRKIDGIVATRAEYQNVELKAARQGAPTRLYDTLSGFSNRNDGGRLPNTSESGRYPTPSAVM